MLGYSQQSAFSRAFKRLRGMTPRQLLATCRGTDRERADE